MKTVYDVQQLLKRFGTIIYIGDRLAELSLMESEIKALYQLQCIMKDEYTQALLILRKESAQLRDKGTK
ncbi:YqgQ family protein [Lentibacillus sp. N15]|uniref:YqgQ family protein n=1 Tax=Lentibacillus songyuanensis TaxID=3136161 RepID=UPI0031BA9B84